jgi:multiple sugar transport system permease protein
MHTPKSLLGKIIVYTLLVLVGLAYIYPIYYATTTAFKTPKDSLAVPPKLFLFEVTLRNFEKAFTDYEIWPALKNSIIISFANMVLSLLIGAPAAFGLSRGRFKGKRFIAYWILSSRMIPPIVMVIPFFILARNLMLYDTHIYLIIIFLTVNLSFVVWMMKSFFDDIPIELDESALIDGCTDFTAFVRIILPLSAPGLAATAVFCLMFNWNQFMYALALTESRAVTLPIAIGRFVGFIGLNWAEMCATAVTTILPILVAAAIAQKYIVKGLTLGAVK